jgi:hypothetical protein
LSLRSTKTAGISGHNPTTQAESSTSTWYAFAGHVTGRILYFDLVRFRGACQTTKDSTYDLTGIGVQAKPAKLLFYEINEVRVFIRLMLDFFLSDDQRAEDNRPQVGLSASRRWMIRRVQIVC